MIARICMAIRLGTTAGIDFLKTVKVDMIETAEISPLSLLT